MTADDVLPRLKRLGEALPRGARQRVGFAIPGRFATLCRPEGQLKGEKVTLVASDAELLKAAADEGIATTDPMTL